tara:strand:+ start:407 stop:547 length:141 start_codon:yes stop_codon:yes gene_type:complete
MLTKLSFQLLLVLTILLLNGCGNKGALYLPEETAERFYVRENEGTQ